MSTPTGRFAVSSPPLQVLSGTLGDVISKAFQRPEFDHVVCCDPDTGLCGIDQTGIEPAFGPLAASNKMCTACAALFADPDHKCCKDCPGGGQDE